VNRGLTVHRARHPLFTAVTVSNWAAGGTQRCQIRYLGSKAYTLFSSKLQRCLPHIQQVDGVFLAHSAKKLKETVFLRVLVDTYIIDSYSNNCSYVSLCDLPLLQTNHGLWPVLYHSPEPTRQYTTFKERGGYLFHGDLYHPINYSHKGEPRQYRKRTAQNADGNSKKGFFICWHVPQHSFPNKIEQEQRPTCCYVIRADTQVVPNMGPCYSGLLRGTGS